MTPITSSESRTSAEVALVQYWSEQRVSLLQRCRHFLRRSEADAEDAFGRATLAMVQSAKTIVELRSPAAWLGELMRNACIDVHRENVRRREDTLRLNEFEDEFTNESHLLEGYPDPERSCMQRETMEFILRTVDVLPPHLRAPLLLRAEEDMSYAVMAGVLFDSEENLRKRVQVARCVIVESLERHREGELQPQPSTNRQPADFDEEPTDLYLAPSPSPIRFLHPVVWVVETPLGTTHRTDFLPMSAALPRYVARRSEQLHQYVVKHPTGWRKRLILSDMLFQAGRFDEAAEHYRAVVARRPAQWEAWMRLASALQYAGRSEEAADVLSWLEEASPSEEVGHFYRGLSWLARGRIDTAQESLLRASTSNECLPALSALATLYAFRGRPKDALDAAQKALEGDPQDIQALLVAYDTTSLAGRTPLADEYLVRALAVQADCVPALLRSFDRAHNGSDSNHAASVLRKLQRIAPDLPEVKSRLVDFYKSRGQVARARRAARSFVEAYPKHPTAWLARARLAFEYDDRDVASIAIQRALELAPDDDEIAMEATRIQREMTRPTHTPPPPRTTCPRKGTRTYDGGGASRV